MKSRRQLWDELLTKALGAPVDQAARDASLDAIEALDDCMRRNDERLRAMYAQHTVFALVKDSRGQKS